MAKSKKRQQIGDVVEITTSKGLAYAQYTHEHTKPPQYCSLLRVLPGTYPERPADIASVIRGKELFVMFFALKFELRCKDTPFRIIGNEPIPHWAVPFPVFRSCLPDRDGNVHDWWLWDGEKEWKVGPLTPEQIRSYPGLGIANRLAMLQMIENGWSSWSPLGRESPETTTTEQSDSKLLRDTSPESPYQMFQMQPEVQADYPARSDLFVGYAAIPALWDRYSSGEAVKSSDYSTCGEIYCYIKIDGIDGLDGSVFEDKKQIEDTLDEALRHFKIGCTIGGGTGLRYSYIDFSTTDTRQAFDIIRKVLCAGKITKNCWILYFDSDKKEQWVGVWEDSPHPP